MANNPQYIVHKENLMKNRSRRIVSSLDTIHNILLQKLGTGNSEIAARASDFLSWIFFNTGPLKETDPEIISLIQPIKEKNIKEISELSNLAKQAMEDSKKYAQYMKDQELKEAKEFFKSAGERNYLRGINTEKILINFLNNTTGTKLVQSGGQNLSTVIIEDSVMPIIDKALKHYGETRDSYYKGKLSKSTILQYIGKDQKGDIIKNNDFTITYSFGSKVDNYLKDCYTVLSNASVKSYSDISAIHLETVDIIKAYTAFLRYVKYDEDLSLQATTNIFNKYYGQNPKIADNPYITMHLNHILKAYAYSGFGTSPIDDLSQIQNGVDYLVVIDNKNKRVIVKSSKEILNYLFSTKLYKINTNVELNLIAAINFNNKQK